MSNTVEFVLRMRDMMSGSLNRLGATSQLAFSRMSQNAQRMASHNRTLAMSYDQIQQRIQQVERTVRTSTIPNQIAAARRELASLQRMAGNHPGSIGGSSNRSSGGMGNIIGGTAIGTMLGGFAMQAGTAFLGVVKDGIGSAISGSMQKEKDIAGLSTFLGKEGANSAYSNIRKDAETSPYGTESLLGVNRALISAGLNAKDAREDTMNLANAIAAVGGGDVELARMAANMQQIKTLGKASALDIKQFGYAGINIYEMLSRSTGKSIAEVREMDVTYDELAKSMAMARSKGGIYAGALEDQSNTKSGRWNAVKDMTKNALTDLGDAMSPIIIQFLTLGQQALSYVGPAIQKITPYITMISDGLGIAINYITNLSNETGGWMDYVYIISDIIMVIWQWQKKLFAQVIEIVGGMLQWISKSEILKDVFHLIKFLLEGVGGVIGWIGDSLLWVWNNALKPLLEGLETAYKWAKETLGLAEDGKITVEVAKKTTTLNNSASLPAVPTTPSYSADLTRFGKPGAIASADATSKKNKEKSKATGDTISGGGPKTINITLGKFFDNIQFTTMNSTESAEKLESIVLECLGRTLYNGAKVI